MERVKLAIVRAVHDAGSARLVWAGRNDAIDAKTAIGVRPPPAIGSNDSGGLAVINLVWPAGVFTEHDRVAGPIHDGGKGRVDLFLETAVRFIARGRSGTREIWNAVRGIESTADRVDRAVISRGNAVRCRHSSAWCRGAKEYLEPRAGHSQVRARVPPGRVVPQPATIVLLDVGQSNRRPGAELAHAPNPDSASGQSPRRALVVVKREPELMEIVLTLHPVGRFPNLLHGGQQQADQNGNDRDDNKQFNQREGISVATRIKHSLTPFLVVAAKLTEQNPQGEGKLRHGGV